MSSLFFDRSRQPSNDSQGADDQDRDLRRMVIAQWLSWSRQIRPGEEIQSLYGEPVWDMLLDLYINEKMSKAISVSSLCHGANVPNTTGLRYIAALEKLGWIRRTPDEADRRRVWINLLPEALEKMDNYVDRLAGIGNAAPTLFDQVNLKRLSEPAS